MIERKLRRRLRLLLVGFLAAMAGAHALRADEMTREIQEELRKRHLYFGDVDGRFTPEVSAALRRYQERKGFPPNGQADETTLRSLTLMPPLAADHLVAALPDVPVLRSDEGLAPEQAGAAAPDNPKENPGPRPAVIAALTAPTPTPAPPPASASAQRPDSAAVRAFIGRYLQAGQTNDPTAELHFYGEHVQYFDDGVVDQRFIEQDVRRYDRRWPDRQFSLAGPLEITHPSDGDPAKVEVRFRYQYTVKSSRLSAAGQTDNEYVLAGSRPEDLRIVSMKEQRVRP